MTQYSYLYERETQLSEVEEIALENLTYGLLEPLHTLVLSKRPKTFDETLKYAVIIESRTQARKEQELLYKSGEEKPPAWLTE